MILRLNSNYYSFQLGSVSGNLRSFETYVPTLLTVSPLPPPCFHYLLPTTFSSFPLTSFSFLMLASIMNKFTGTARNILLLNIPCGKVPSKLLISDRCPLRDAKLPNSVLSFLLNFATCEWKWRWEVRQQPLPLRYRPFKCSNYSNSHPGCWKFTYSMCAGIHQPTKIRPAWITTLFELLSKINTLRTFFQKKGRTWEITLSTCMNSSWFTHVHTHTECNASTFSNDGFSSLPPLAFSVR